MGNNLIIEFVPKTDEKVKQLLLHREDIFDSYNIQDFKKYFNKFYNFLNEEKVGNTDRILFLLQKKR